MAILRNCQKPVTNSNTPYEKEPVTGFVVCGFPHIKEDTMGHIFAKPRDPITEEHRTDAIYSIACNECDYKYIKQTKRQ
ncbi:hypothetical protein pdam_00007035, partial [Pocillopora damicornis]